MVVLMTMGVYASVLLIAKNNALTHKPQNFSPDPSQNAFPKAHKKVDHKRERKSQNEYLFLSFFFFFFIIIW